MRTIQMEIDPTDYRHHVVLAEVRPAKQKVGISNRIMFTSEPVYTNKQRVLPALVHYSEKGYPNGRILFQNQWMEGQPDDFRQGAYGDHYWYHLGPQDGHSREFYVWLDGIHYYGCWLFVDTITRTYVRFKDGSELKGQHALTLWYTYQQDRCYIDHYLKEEDGYVCFRNSYRHALHTEPCNDPPQEYVYRGTGSLMLSSYQTPIINRTPFKIKLAKAYNTVACGFASAIWSHPGCLLECLDGGSAYSFACWREHPAQETETGTVITYDAQHNELVVCRKKTYEKEM